MWRKYSTKDWTTMLSLSGWVFQQLTYDHFQFPPTLHVGDYNMDGFPDIVTVLTSPTLVVVMIHPLCSCQLWAWWWFGVVKVKTDICIAPLSKKLASEALRCGLHSFHTANTPHLHLPRKHSPADATNSDSSHLITAYYSLMVSLLI